MFVWGFCYAGTEGKAGFRPMGTVPTAGLAIDEIEKKLAGKRVEFSESGDKFRAIADSEPTGYIYFQADRTEPVWLLIDQDRLSLRGKKCVVKSGVLSEVKDAARKKVEKEYKGFSIDKMIFEQTSDNITVKFKEKGELIPTTTDFILVKAG